MNTDTLFEMPEPTPVKRKPPIRGQVYKCKRCKHSESDPTGAYCVKFDLCIEFENGKALLSKTGTELTCDKIKWTY